MHIEFRLPSLTATDVPGQIRQLHSFLRTTVEQLNLALGQLDTPQPQTAAPAQVTPAEQFGALKGLIIQSADIVTAYYHTIDQLLTTGGKYVAQSAYGKYQETVSQTLSAQENRITQSLSLTQAVDQQLRTQESYLRYGTVGTTLDADAALTAPGIEIGDFRTHTGDAGVKRRFARFTPYGLEFFGQSKDTPIAYISGDRLHITGARVTDQLQLGGYQLSTHSGLAFHWTGGGQNG